MNVRQLFLGSIASLFSVFAYAQTVNQAAPAYPQTATPQSAASPGAAIANSPQPYTPPNPNNAPPAASNPTGSANLPSPGASGGSATVIVPAGPSPDAIVQEREAKRAAKAKYKAKKKASKQQYQAQKKTDKDQYQAEKREADLQRDAGESSTGK